MSRFLKVHSLDAVRMSNVIVLKFLIITLLPSHCSLYTSIVNPQDTAERNITEAEDKNLTKLTLYLPN